MVTAAVELEEQAFGGHALTAAAVTWRPPSSGRGDAFGSKDPTYARAAEFDSLALGEQLGQMRVVSSGVAGRGQADHSIADIFADPPLTGSPSIAVDQAGRSCRSELAQQTPELAFRAAKRGCGVTG
jgi:hypothetical protein